MDINEIRQKLGVNALGNHVENQGISLLILIKRIYFLIMMLFSFTE